MGPQAALLVAALAGCLLRARSCVICDPRVVAALDALEKEYLSTHLAPGRHRQVMERIRETVRDFRDLPYLEDTFMGVIDEATMETSVLSFLRSVSLIRNSGVADDTFVKEFSWMLTLEKAAFQGYVARFQRKDFCPNKCGTMLQLLIWCSNCKKQLHACRKSRDCGVRQINVHETEDLILDCELDWHKLSQGLTYYSFYRVWGSNSETLVSEGKRPTLIKRLVRPEDAGNYRCELGTERSGPATVIHFEVTVLPKRVIGEIPKSKPGTQYQRFGSLKPSECLNPKDVLRGFLFEMLIWGFVFLLLGFLPSVLCFRSGALIDSVKSWVRTDKAAAPEDQGPQSRLSQTQLSQTQLSQSQVSQTQLPKVPNEEKATAPRLK
ncbi:LOW QUALITY PROTEIN: izumo sperm-egg fusion protein 1-like [Lynx canadensis]|uniref:LOW QUALITY PROTEIN: izumo sperm-egg fusion protein 1-like n=1 Tax=Lynx canadensis TaxID=61383 RepID=UPI0011AFFA73|nr:LOW QUALITY PROTEIN: izumo sperm-egg fusion protein 1-like [Lynx canadensis]